MIINRREATRKGLAVFYMKPCKYKHIGGRLVSNSKCVECLKINNKFSKKLAIDRFIIDKQAKDMFRNIMKTHVKKARADFATLTHRIKKDRQMNVMSILGYTAEELKLHITHKFKSGMTWNNHGEWEFDHVMPIYSFTLYNSSLKYSVDEFSIKVNSLSNIQPLWDYENIKKSYKF